ncbi:MAG: DUF1579 domain-containing protein [Isosphaeraceae bacterium]
MTIRKLMGLAASLVIGAAGVAAAQDIPVTKPTAEHQRLHDGVGTWDATIKTWMQGPDSEPSVSQGLEKSRLMPGGLWLITEFEGKFGDLPFHGASQTGYDPLKKKYVGSWVDSMSHSLLLTEGEYDPETKTTTSFAKGTDPSGKPFEAKMTEVQKDRNHRVFTMSMKSDETKGEYVKSMEITYVRRDK